MEETNECYRLVVDLVSYEIIHEQAELGEGLVDSVTYQKPSARLIGYTNDYPLFGRLETYIYIVNSTILFNITLRPLMTTYKHTLSNNHQTQVSFHIHSYSIHSPCTFIVSIHQQIILKHYL